MDQLTTFLDFISNDSYVQATLIVVGSFILAKLADLLLGRFIKSMAGRTRSDLDDKLLDILHKPIFRTVVLIGLSYALEFVTEPGSRPLFVGRGSIITLIILIWVATGLRLSGVVIDGMSRNESRFQIVQAATVPLFDIAAKVVIFALGSYLVLVWWDINISGWLASAGIIGLGIGLAAQDTFSNLFAGLSILADSPYKIGDFIVLDGTERGKVVRIGLRSTRVLTNDQVEVTIPNSIIANSKVVNESGGPTPKQRLRVGIGVAYGVDIDEVEQLLLRVAESEDAIARTPSPHVHFLNFGASSLDFELRCWVAQPEARERAINNLNRKMYKALNEAGIEIPFPKRDIYIKEMPRPEA